MVRAKRAPARKRGGDAPGWRSPQRGDDERWGMKSDDDDDPLRDLRPHDEEMQDQPSDEYMWPQMTDDDEEND